MEPKMSIKKKIAMGALVAVFAMAKSLLSIAGEVLKAVIVVFFAALIAVIVAKLAVFAGLVFPVANLPGWTALVALLSFIAKEAK